MRTHIEERQIAESLEEAGFSEAQVEALLAAFTVHHHSHPIDEIVGLAEQLEEIESDDDDSDADEDEDEG